jgi:adenine-specific DNA methylase
VDLNIDGWSSLCDIFSGSGVVGDYFNERDKRVISNDLLHHNFITNSAFLDNRSFNLEKVKSYIDSYNSLDIKIDNYFSINFGDRYFSLDIAKKIGFIREDIEDKYIKREINLKEKYILITSLIYAMDKIANTVGHYDAYIKKSIKGKSLILKPLDINLEKNIGNRVYNRDANSLIREIECDVLYIDPPYNSRQYCDLYHLLENLALWQKPKLFGIAKKFDRTNLKSEYNKKEALRAFEDLIINAKAKYILLSYNNMGDKGNSRSNAKMSDGEILSVLKKKGKVEVFEKSYREFNSGKSSIKDNKERIFFVKVIK